MISKLPLFTTTLAVSLLACAPAAEGPRPAPQSATTRASDAETSRASAAPVKDAEAPPDEEVLLVTERAALRAIEARGSTLAMRLAAAAPAAHTPPFEALLVTIENELAAIGRADPRSGVGVGDKPHRLFDVRYLRSRDARFELTGVVNRADRAPFSPGSCGEVRLVYRLAYSKSTAAGPVASRLPATVALEFVVPGADDNGSPAKTAPADACRAAAQRWRAPKGLSGEALGAWLTGDEGPLGATRLAAYTLSAVTLNVQTVRWPSTVRPDLGGHAEYLLQSFRVDPHKGLTPKPLENTPDVARIQRDPSLRRALLTWLAAEESLAAIDAGTPALPEKLLAMRAVSVSPRGLARRANRPFRQLFEPRELASLPLAGRAHIGSPAALLRRLDELSCQGCHQSRSIAGFHLLGEEEPENRGANALAVPVSPHLGDEVMRRRALVEALAAGRPADFVAPFAERADGVGARGAHCGLGDPGFAGWTCAAGLSCIEEDTSSDALEVGVCLPAGDSDVGDACEVARVGPETSGRRDRVEAVARRACQSPGVCDRNVVGFPGGMCATTCAAAEASGRGVCGRIPILVGFNDCLARKIPFEQCIAENVRPAGLASCDAASPCRDDYVCARTASGAGACMPPYFLFQLRVDGHPPGG